MKRFKQYLEEDNELEEGLVDSITINKAKNFCLKRSRFRDPLCSNLSQLSSKKNAKRISVKEFKKAAIQLAKRILGNRR